MTKDRLYLKVLETPAGNRGHELVSIVTAATVADARQASEDALRERRDACRMAEVRAEAARRQARSHAIWDMAEGLRAHLALRNSGRGW